MSIRTITHKGNEIIFVDYTGLKGKEASLELLAKSVEALEQFDSPIPLLANLEDAITGPEFMKRSKELGSTFKNKTSKAALLGITGIKKILLQAYNKATGDNMIPFRDKDAALEWLVS